MAGPMDGVQVVEVGMWVAGPAGAAILGDWGAEVVKVEYYPQRMFSDDDKDRGDAKDEAARADRERQRERRREKDIENRIERQMNKTALITLWIDPAEHQIVKYTFDNVWLDFLPGGWLVRVDDIGASMTMGQPFPGVWLPRAINITVPNPPGGMNQIHAQPLSAVLERLTKQPAPIVNRPGGTAAIGTAYVANQPDGYNILVTTPNLYLVIEKDKLYGIKSPFSLDQISLLALLSADPLIMVVHPSMPVKSPKELAALAKKRPNEIVFSSSGPYGITHTPTAMFMHAAGIKMRHLPTNGGGPALNAILGNNSQVLVSSIAAASPHMRAGKLRALAAFGEKRAASASDVPTLKELGYDVQFSLWVGLFAPKGTPMPIVERLSGEARKVAESQQFQNAIHNIGDEVAYLDHNGFAKFWDEDAKRVETAVKSIGLVKT